MILRVVLLLFARVWCVDANVPYRLFRASSVAGALARVPEKFFLSNVALAVLLRRDPAIRESAIPIRFRERYGGEPTVSARQFQGKALELICDLPKLDAPPPREAQQR